MSRLAGIIIDVYMYPPFSTLFLSADQTDGPQQSKERLNKKTKKKRERESRSGETEMRMQEEGERNCDERGQ